MHDFFVTLLSNTNENDSISNFKVRLPNPIALKGEYSVALTRIIYPFTFDSINTRKEDVNFNANTIWIETATNETLRCDISPFTYQCGSELMLLTLKLVNA